MFTGIMDMEGFENHVQSMVNKAVAEALGERKPVQTETGKPAKAREYDRRVYFVNGKQLDWVTFNKTVKAMFKKHKLAWQKSFESGGFYPLRRDARWADPHKRQITYRMVGGWTVSAKRV